MVLQNVRASYRHTLTVALCLMMPVAVVAQDDADMLDIAKTAYNEQEYDAAFEIWTPLADGGNIDAQLALADAALFCDCVDEGTNIAARYYHMAAKTGNVYALRQMGWIYSVKGDDPAEASIYYKAAADMGDAESQVELGDLYRAGLGGAETLKLMPTYYQKAAEQGDRAGYARMAYLYAGGGPIPADPTKAYIAQSIAAALSFPMAKEEAVEAAKKLTTEQLVHADELVAQCVEAQYLKCL
jgi:uncharacterized protein